MADHSAPDYELEETLTLDRPEQYRALFEPTRIQITDLVLERAATVSEIADTLGKPKGSVGHHMAVLEAAELVRVVRTKKVRAIEAKYYGRTARTYLLMGASGRDTDIAPDVFLTEAAAEYAKAAETYVGQTDATVVSTLRHVRIPEERAREWALRLGELAHEFTGEPKGGELTYGLLLALYPTDRPHLPDLMEAE
jgi:DNA-binding transcriptional ArsR family regulator